VVLKYKMHIGFELHDFSELRYLFGDQISYIKNM
jgi:hypothetical protein